MTSLEIRKTERLYRLTEANEVIITDRNSSLERDSGYRMVHHERDLSKIGRPNKLIWIDNASLAERTWDAGRRSREEAFAGLCERLYYYRELETYNA